MPKQRGTNPGLQASLSFSEGERADAPLAARMRPRTLDEFVGQPLAVGPDALLGRVANGGALPSVVLWGPPGCGKTTLARILARETEGEFIALSAVASGVAELRRVINEAQQRREAGIRTILFIDEIHRFNKAQQDVILPYVENGTVTLLGATTENPSFEVVAPLLSRVRVARLEGLEKDDLARIINRALADSENGLGSSKLSIEETARNVLIEGSQGDARSALNALEIAADATSNDGRSLIEAGDVRQALQERRPYYDKEGDYHYDAISAFIKSMRGSDPDATIYWLARMLEAGEDPLFIVRRMVILAAEDIGLADPQALSVATSCQQAVHFIGMPEGFLPMSECALYLALAPKSNSALTAYVRASEDAKRTSHLPIPLHLRNAATGLMREMGYGAGYRYAHDEPDHYAKGERYLPKELGETQYYQAGMLGVEPTLSEHRNQQKTSGEGHFERDQG